MCVHAVGVAAEAPEAIAAEDGVVAIFGTTTMEANLRQLDHEDKRDTTSRTMASRTMRLIDAASIGGTLPGRQYTGSSDLRGPVLRANPSRTFATNVSAEDQGLLACGKCCLNVAI